jgi:voltage-gated sodium channel
MKENIFARIANNPIFQRFVVGVIVVSGVLVGLETYPNLYSQYKATFKAVDYVIQGIFTIEIIVRILAYGRNPLKFFTHANNVIDFLITALFYVPFGGAYASVFRLIRIIRIFRLVTALPRLQILVGALIKSIPSMGWISLLLLIAMYVYAVLGSFLFGASDPEHFGNLGITMLTLFQIITLEGWTEIMKQQGDGIVPILYFISFILIGTMIILNLFIGVVINGFDEVKKEIEQELDKKTKRPALKKEMAQISEQLDALRQRMDMLIKEEKKPRKKKA